MSVLDIITSIAREMLDTFFLNYLFIFLCIVIILAVRAQYERYVELRGEMGGLPAKDFRQVTEEIILTGLVAGFFCSFAVIAVGITINQDAVKYLFYIMCLLLLINMRFLCISSAAGLLIIINLIFGSPGFDIPSMLGLVAILHFIEAALVYLNKGRDSIPVYIRHQGEISGAYLTRKFWIIPVVFLTFLAQNTYNALTIPGGGWWMLFGPESLKTGAYALGLDCLVAVLSYSDIAITKHPEKKSRETAELLFCYSALLITTAVASVSIHWLVYLGAVICIAGHEGIYLYGRWMEKKGSPLYSPAKRGLRVLEVIPGGLADKMDVGRGDVILGVNGRDIQTDEGLVAALKDYPTFVWVDLKKPDGTEKTCEYWCYPGGCDKLGIISVPREKDITYNINNFEHMSIIKNIVTRFRGMNKSA